MFLLLLSCMTLLKIHKQVLNNYNSNLEKKSPKQSNSVVMTKVQGKLKGKQNKFKKPKMPVIKLNQQKQPIKQAIIEACQLNSHQNGLRIEQKGISFGLKQQPISQKASIKFWTNKLKKSTRKVGQTNILLNRSNLYWRNTMQLWDLQMIEKSQRYQQIIFMIKFTKSLIFAAQKHKNQRRDGGVIPYVNHLLQVAQILGTAGVEDFNVLIAGVLHDTLEDTQTTIEELQQQFGEKITKIVLQFTDDQSLGKVQIKLKQINQAIQASNEAKMVRIADKMSNNLMVLANTPPKWSKDRFQGYFICSQTICNKYKGANLVLDNHIEQMFQKVEQINILNNKNKFY